MIPWTHILNMHDFVWIFIAKVLLPVQVGAFCLTLIFSRSPWSSDQGWVVRLGRRPHGPPVGFPTQWWRRPHHWVPGMFFSVPLFVPFCVCHFCALSVPFLCQEFCLFPTLLIPFLSILLPHHGQTCIISITISGWWSHWCKIISDRTLKHQSTFTNNSHWGVG